MAVTHLREEDLDDYLLSPDCPDCGSEDVDLIATLHDGGYVVRQYRCNTCGHVWTERTPAGA